MFRSVFILQIYSIVVINIRRRLRIPATQGIAPRMDVWEVIGKSGTSISPVSPPIKIFPVSLLVRLWVLER